jgi:hypothetical protein
MTDFFDAVAARAGQTPEEVRTALARHGVLSYTPRGTAARLRLARLEFSGFKDPDGDPPAEAFEFQWELREGVQALASVRNSVGKTSVLEVCRWMLTGRERHTVGGLDPRVRAMLHHVRLEFRLGDETCAVDIDTASERAPGRLEVGGQHIGFTSDTMADVVGTLMLDRLRLERMAHFTHPGGSSRGTVAEHGWPLLSGALVVGPSHLEAVIGTVPTEAGRVLQVYLALPWYETLTQARTARNALNQKLGDRVKDASAMLEARKEATAQLEQQLARAEAELRALPDEAALVGSVSDAVVAAGDRNRELAAAEEQVAAAMADHERASEVHLQAQRDLVAAKEHETASVFFRALQPALCPRCDAPITDERLDAEAEGHTCSVCTRHHEPDHDDDAIAIAEEAAERTQAAVQAAEQRLDTIGASAIGARRARDAAQRLVQELSERRDTGKRQAKLIEVERLRGRLEERGVAAAVVEDPAGADPDVDVLNAAVGEAEELVREQDELLEQLNDRILRLGQRFGVAELTDVKLDRAARLPAWKGETRYNYRQLSEGDQLRLKVAVVVALLQVGEERGLGHHPGLLIVDSPGAQEVGAAPLEEMLTALSEVTQEQSLQVLVATARRDEAVAALGADRVRQPASDDEALW